MQIIREKGVEKLKKYEFHMPDGSILTKCIDVDRYYKLNPQITATRLYMGWTEEECANNQREGDRNYKKYEFHMPDGSILTKCSEVDKYYDLGNNVTASRIRRGWSIDECVNNEKCSKRKFIMPNGSVFSRSVDVDKYYGLCRGATNTRLYKGWTEQECADNKRVVKGKYEFHMPDGSLLTKCIDVDEYYNLVPRTTAYRLKRGWTVEDCANNARIVDDTISKYKFPVPDVGILTKCMDVDKHYNLRIGTTACRLDLGWTEKECAENERKSGLGLNKYEFHMPDGSVLKRCIDVDDYYNLKHNTTSHRLLIGWTEQECADNSRDKLRSCNSHIYEMPNGEVTTVARDVDRYYKLNIGTTTKRYCQGWTDQECANNKRDKGKGNNRFEFNMPDGSVLKRCNDVDEYYGLERSTTVVRLSRGWTEQECANNTRDKGKGRNKYEFNMPDGSVLKSVMTWIDTTV